MSEGHVAWQFLVLYDLYFQVRIDDVHSLAIPPNGDFVRKDSEVHIQIISWLLGASILIEGAIEEEHERYQFVLLVAGKHAYMFNTLSSHYFYSIQLGNSQLVTPSGTRDDSPYLAQHVLKYYIVV